DYCAREGLSYGDRVAPVPLATFTAYAQSFAKEQVGDMSTAHVTRLTREDDGYTLTVENGEVWRARRVVLAVGITAFAHLPDFLAALPRDTYSHSFAHHDLSRFAGKDVAVIGGGASAVDVAAALHEAGARTRIVARTDALRFHDAPTDEKRPLMDRVLRPMSG